MVNKGHRGFMDVLHEVRRMQERMYGTGAGVPQEDQQRTQANAWVPNTDVFSQGGDLVIWTELAGISPEDIHITFSDGVLTISGERPSTMGGEKEVSNYVRELFYGTFTRSMSLPEGIDERDIHASFEYGLVKIVVKGGAATPPAKRIQFETRKG
jgi:HSP20 family protein